MSTPPQPSDNLQDDGLDDVAETERPGLTTVRMPEGISSPTQRLRVVVEHVVVEGEDAQALAQRQTIAIREVLEWLYAHRGDAACKRRV
ncbi:hypothetical protein ACFC09_21040 [Streptomyces sp. NPDC056161]|uniref:hypothetical protein n=1 Tax=Streptomyces sp. NPDC056161 TaxID=3345732 RepID=UPI0035D5E453